MKTRPPLANLSCSNIRKKSQLRVLPIHIGSCNDLSKAANNKKGRWNHEERMSFLRGLQIYGRGNWKKISTIIPTRTCIQVKSHAQVILKKIDNGLDIFDMLSNECGQWGDTSSWKSIPASMPAFDGPISEESEESDKIIAAQSLILLSSASKA